MFKISRFDQLLVIITLVMTLLAAPSTGTITAAAKGFSATLTPIAGLVQFQRAGDLTWTTLQEAILVNQGDQIRTGNDGLASLNIVTGIQVSMSNSSQMELNKLVLCADNGALQYTIFLHNGEVMVSADQKIQTNDHVQLTLPTAGITVDGNGFYALVTPQFNATIVGLKNATTVTLNNKTATRLNPNDLLHININLPSPAPSAFTADFLDANVSAVLVVGKTADVTQQDAVKLFLKESLTSRYNLQSEAFLRDLLGLPALAIDTLTADQETAALQDTLKAIDNFDTSQLNLNDVLNKFFVILKSYQTNLTSKGLAPTTCGNGVADSGETAVNCATDVVDVNATCGDGIVETDGKNIRGESVVNCYADGLPLDDLAHTGLVLIDEVTNNLSGCADTGLIITDASGIGNVMSSSGTPAKSTKPIISAIF